MNKSAINSGHGMIEHEAGVDMVNDNTLADGALCAPKNVAGFAGESFFLPDLRGDYLAAVMRPGGEQPGGA